MSRRSSCAWLLVVLLTGDSPLRALTQAAQTPRPQPPPGEVIRAGNEEVTKWLERVDTTFTGPRVDAEDRPVAEPVVHGLELTHVLNIQMLDQGARTLDTIYALPPEQKLIILDALTPLVAEAQNVYANLVAAEVTARDPEFREKSIYNSKMERAQGIAISDPAGAVTLRAEAARSPWGVYLFRKDQFFSILQRQPLLGLLYDTYAPFDEQYLFRKLDFLPPNQSRLEVFDNALQNTANEMRGMAADARAITEFEDLLDYASPRYAPVHAQAQALSSGPNGLTRYADLVAPLPAMAEAWRYDSLITTATTDILLNVASTLIIVVPVWGPLLSAGFQVIQIVREGDQYRVAFLTAEDSKASAFTFGQTRVISDQDRAAAERGEFVFAAVSGSFDIAQTLATPTAAGTKAASSSGSSVGPDVVRSPPVDLPTATAAPPRGTAATPTAGSTIDRGATTVVDVAGARADAVTLGRRIEETRAAIAGLESELAAAVASARPDLVRRREELVKAFNEVDAEFADLTSRRDRAIAQPFPGLGPANRGAETYVDVRAVGDDLQRLYNQKNELMVELEAIDAQLAAIGEQMRAGLVTRRDALRKQLSALAEEQVGINDVIAREIGSGDYQQAIEYHSGVARQRVVMARQLDELIDRITATTDPAARRALERQRDALQQQFDDLTNEHMQLGKYLDGRHDEMELEDALDDLNEQIGLARASGVSESRIEEITRGAGQTQDADAIVEMTTQLSAARITSQPGVQVISATNPAHRGLINGVLQDFAFVRGALVEARATGQLSDTSIAYINVRRSQDPNWFTSLSTRVVESGGAGQYFRAGSDDLAQELKGLFDNRARVTPASANQAAAPPSRAPRIGAVDQLRLAQSLYQLGVTTGQTARTATEVNNTPQVSFTPAAGPNTGAMAPAPVVDRSSELSDLDAQIERADKRFKQLWQLHSETADAGQRAAIRQEGYALLEQKLRAQVKANEIRLKQLWDDAHDMTNGLTVGARVDMSGQYAALREKQYSTLGQLDLVRALYVPGKSGKSRAEAPGTGTASTPAVAPFASAITPGPAFAVSGIGTPGTETTKTATATGVASPSTIVASYLITAALNAPILAKASALLKSQLLGATSDGKTIEVEGASSSPKDEADARSRASRPWFLELPVVPRLALAGPWTRAVSAARAPRLRLYDTASATQGAFPPVKVIVTSLGRSAGDAFEMTLINEAVQPVRLDGRAVVLEPVGNVTRAAAEKAVSSATRSGRLTTTLKGYCLEFLKLPPTSGMLFRIAPDATQRRFAFIAGIFDASRKLVDAGLLRPPSGDPSDPAAYFDSLRQWAIWAREESFDEARYTRAFVDHSRKNVEAAKQRWTSELQGAITALAPARWQAIRQVLAEAQAGEKR